MARLKKRREERGCRFSSFRLKLRGLVQRTSERNLRNGSGDDREKLCGWKMTHYSSPGKSASNGADRNAVTLQ